MTACPACGCKDANWREVDAKPFPDFMAEVLSRRLYADAYSEAVDMWAAFAMWQRMREAETESRFKTISIRGPEPRTLGW